MFKVFQRIRLALLVVATFALTTTPCVCGAAAATISSASTAKKEQGAKPSECAGHCCCAPTSETQPAPVAPKKDNTHAYCCASLTQLTTQENDLVQLSALSSQPWQTSSDSDFISSLCASDHLAQQLFRLHDSGGPPVRGVPLYTLSHSFRI